MEKLVYYIFERWAKSGKLLNALAEVKCKYPKLIEQALEYTDSNEIIDHCDGHGKIVEPEIQADLYLSAAKGDSEIRRKHIGRQPRRAPQR